MTTDIERLSPFEVARIIEGEIELAERLQHNLHDAPEKTYCRRVAVTAHAVAELYIDADLTLHREDDFLPVPVGEALVCCAAFHEARLQRIAARAA